jgi:hypothetical protein
LRIFVFVAALTQLLRSIVSSLTRTLSDLGVALRTRSSSKLVGLVREGSPLESFLDSLLSLVFWVLLLSPLFLVPALYLIVSFAR